MNIIEAIKLAREGNKIRIKGWHNTIYIYVKYPETEITLYKYIDAQTPERVASFYEGDILSEDWEIKE
jgi:hypothetical protein